jgi:hypothetical protein
LSTERADKDALSQLRAANPVPVEELRATIDGEHLRRAAAAAISLGEAGNAQEPAPQSPRDGFRLPRISAGGSRRRGRRATLVGSLAAVGLIALVVLLVGGPVNRNHPTFAAAAIAVAEANPRLLVTSPGWSVTNAGEFEAGEGEVTFSDGTHHLSINWYPARMYRSYLRDRAMVSPPKTSRLLGQVATTVHYFSTEYATMLFPQGPVFVEVRGRLGSHAEYVAVLHSLRHVGVDTWLAAMPANVVRPEVRAAAIERMLRSVPLPPGFDVAQLEQGNWVANHYQLAVKVAGSVSCGWVESWLAATKAGDQARAHEAVEAMATSRHWPMMPLLIKGGGWSGNVWHAADALASGHVDRGASGAVVRPDGSGYMVGPSWALGLNCTSRYWRRPFDHQPPLGK